MKRLQVFLILGLLMAVGFAYRHLAVIESNNPTTGFAAVTAAPANGKDAETSSAAVHGPVTSNMEKLIEKEAETMSQLNDHPEEVQKRLRDLAEKVQDSDISVLQKTALNTNVDGDQRFLSVYILGESSLQKAQESLEHIAITPIPKMGETRLTMQEEVIRAQAVESLRQPESLKRVLSRADNSFITDRAQRTLLYRESKVSSPEKQDQDALNQLLEKSSR